MGQPQPLCQRPGKKGRLVVARSRSRWRCSGTGTTASAVSLPPSAPTSSASRPANHAPSGSIRSNFSSRMACTSAPSYTARLRARSNAYVLSPQAGQSGASSSFMANAASGRPHTSQMVFGIAANDERHSSRIGIRLASASSRSQIRHPAGKNTLASASPASAIHPRTPLRRVPEATLDELPSPMQPELCSSASFIERRNVRLGNPRFCSGGSSDPCALLYPLDPYSSPCSIFSWHAMQCLAHGTASSRFCCISSWQFAHTP
jgi:hypothetical protein